MRTLSSAAHPGWPRLAPSTLRLLLAIFALLEAAGSARAGGMFLPARGARPLGRAGSFVAGADDLEAVVYNPAGLAGTGHLSLLLDVGLVFQNVHYERVDSGGNTRPAVDDNNGIIPIPTMGISWRPDALGKRLTFAFAVFVPYTGLPQYDPKGPQRYSLVSLNGTALAVTELALSVRVTPEFYLGAGFQNMIVSLSDKTVLAGCTQLNCAPEDPRFDAATQSKTTSFFTPSANFGALYVSRYLRLGASVQLPFYVRSSGTVATRLPSDPQFDGAQVVGNQIDVNLDLPLVVRAGAELRPTKHFRVEVGYDYERWSQQDKLEFIPRGVSIDHVAGIGKYELRAMHLDRGMQDTHSLHVGGEYDVLPKRLTVRAGYLYESSAVPDAYLSVITPDGDKHLLAIGGAVRLGSWRLDVAYGHFFQADRYIRNSKSLQLNPIEPSIVVAVGNGLYAVSSDVLSLGFEKRF